MRYEWLGNHWRPGGGSGERDGRDWRCGCRGWPDLRCRHRARQRRAGDRRDRAGGGSRLHRPARARPVDPGRPHAGVRRGDDDARPRGGRIAGRILVSAPGRQGTRAELRRRRQLGLRAHRRDDRLQRGKLAGGVRQCHARSPLDRQRGQRHRGGRHPRPPCHRTERGRHRHRHSQRLCPGRRRPGADRGVPTGGGA